MLIFFRKIWIIFNPPPLKYTLVWRHWPFEKQNSSQGHSRNRWWLQCQDWHETKQFWMGHWLPRFGKTDVLTELDFSCLLCWITSVWLIHGSNTNRATLTLGDPEMVEPAIKWTIYSFLVAGSQWLKTRAYTEGRTLDQKVDPIIFFY